jgi:hypothetical protein
MKRAIALGSARNVALGLTLANELLGAPIPPELESQIRGDRVTRALADQVREALFNDEDNSVDIADWQKYHLKARERLRDRTRLRVYYYGRYLRLVTSPTATDQATFPLPSYLAFLHRVLRPIRLVSKYGVAFAMKRFRRG